MANNINNFDEVNARIQEIEQWQREGMDKTEATSLLSEALDDFSTTGKVIPMKDFKMPIIDEKNSIFSGIKKFDEIVGRLKKGDVFTITAASGVGKSTFSRELLLRFAKQGKKSLYFSYEDRNEGLIEKLGDDIPDGYIPEVLSDKSIVWIEARILEAVNKYGVEIIFIDNLKSITDFMARNVNNSIEFTMQKIKEIAMKYNVMIFVCAHIKKEEGKEIDLNSIKDSSAIADISSLVVALRRNPDKNQTKEDREENGVRMSNLTTISIIKNRNNGIQKGFAMMFKPKGVSGRYDEDLNSNIINKEDIKKLL